MPVFQLFVVGMEAGVCTVSVAETPEEFLKTTVAQLRTLLKARWPDIDSDESGIRLLFAGKQLQNTLVNGKEATLEHYNIQNHSTLHAVFRLPGGSNFSVRIEPPPESEKVHDLSDFSLQFTTSDPDAIFGFSEPGDQPRVKMSCGHAVDANSLTVWCRSLLDKQEWEFYCPGIVDGDTKQCKTKWEYAEVRKIALFNEAEQKYFESKMSEYAAQQYCDMKECPGCRSFVERRDLKNLRVHCLICTKKKGKDYDFCWNCEKEWSGPITSAVKCGNDTCEHPSLSGLRTAEKFTLNGKQVHCRRACPTCGNVVEHKQEGCKYMICPRCKNEFCFLCLDLKADCMNAAPLSWFKGCKKKVAPMQTEIPLWSQSA